MRAGNSLENFLKARIKDGQISATTLTFTFFCDVVTQHGGEIWLGNVIRTLAPLGINERLTRTAVFRLVKDGWLESRKQGRRSYYRLTATGENYYQRAAERIYSSNVDVWDGVWTLVFTSQADEDKRDVLNRGLLWLGYGRLANSVFARPRHPDAALDELLRDLGLDKVIVCMQARSDSVESLQALASSQWKLDSLQSDYQHFIRHYQRALETLKTKEPPDPHHQLLLRILLIHEYRKILLSDPELPIIMLPANWPGARARSLTAGLYRRLLGPTAAWVKGHLHGPKNGLNDGPETEKYRFPVSREPLNNEPAMDRSI